MYTSRRHLLECVTCHSFQYLKLKASFFLVLRSRSEDEGKIEPLQNNRIPTSCEYGSSDYSEKII